MNPILAEDIMRQRAHRSVIVLATLLTWLLVTPDRASALDGITVVVPVNVTGLHEEVTSARMVVYFFDSASQTNTASELGHPGAVVGGGSATGTVVDRSFVGDWEVEVNEPTPSTFTPYGLYITGAVPDLSIFNATHYRISLRLVTAQDSGPIEHCEPNRNYENIAAQAHCNQSAYIMETYEIQEGPITDLIPQ
jgi:hypothetical protein